MVHATSPLLGSIIVLFPNVHAVTDPEMEAGVLLFWKDERPVGAGRSLFWS